MKTSEPQIDVVMPVYNGAAWLGATLDSVVTQTHAPARVFVVDDGSTDGSADIARRYPRVTLLRNPGKGSSMARNHGLQAAAAPYIAFMDHDDLWHPRHLEILIKNLTGYPDHAGIASCYQIFHDGQSPHFDVSDTGCHTVDLQETYPVITGEFLSCAFLFKREFVHLVGGWPSYPKGGLDYVLWCKIATHAKMLKGHARTLGYRIHEGSMFQTIMEEIRNVWQLNRVLSDAVLDYYLGRIRDNRKRFFMKRRNAILYGLYAVLDDLSGGQFDRLPADLLELERGLTGESERFIRYLARHLDFFVSHLAPEKPGACEHYRTLIGRCPARAARVAAMLSDLLARRFPGLKFYAKCLRREPFNYTMYIPVVKAVRNKIKPGAGFAPTA